jgi:hypothetical protein
MLLFRLRQNHSILWCHPFAKEAIIIGVEFSIKIGTYLICVPRFLLTVR